MATTCKKVCPICGQTFIARRSNIKYCSDVCKIRAASKKVVKSTYVRICKHCGKEFETSNARKTFCNNDCYLAYTENKRHEASKKIVITRTCIICGKEFDTINKRKLTCSLKCSEENSRRKAKKRYEYLSGSRVYHNTCIICGREFDTANKRKVTCSSKCADENSRRSVKKRYKSLSGIRVYHNTCIICGKEYTTSRPDQLCCSPECSLKNKHDGSSDNYIYWYKHKDTNFDKKIHNMYKDYEQYCIDEKAKGNRPITFSQYYTKTNYEKFVKRAIV